MNTALPPCSNLHTHCRYCDGKGVQEDYVRRAVQLGCVSLGFSSHAPLPFPCEWVMDKKDLPAYAAEAARLKHLYGDRIQLYTGLEIDYVPGVIAPSRAAFAEVELDFVIGSVHFVQRSPDGPHYEIDGPLNEFEEHLRLCCDGDAKKLVLTYYENLRKMLAESAPDIVGHFDVVRKNNSGGRFFDEAADWYMSAVRSALDEAARADVLVEVNTGAIARGYGDILYPDRRLLTEARQRGIRMCINSDAHDPQHIGAADNTARAALRDAGYDEYWILADGGWKPVRL